MHAALVACCCKCGHVTNHATTQMLGGCCDTPLRNYCCHSPLLLLPATVAASWLASRLLTAVANAVAVACTPTAASDVIAVSQVAPLCPNQPHLQEVHAVLVACYCKACHVTISPTTQTLGEGVLVYASTPLVLQLLLLLLLPLQLLLPSAAADVNDVSQVAPLHPDNRTCTKCTPRW
jgi:hypothetical protein